MKPHIGKMARLRLVFELARQRAREGHLSVARQGLEMIALTMLRRVGPTYYHTGGFWRRDMRWEAKTGHLGSRAYNAAVRRLNPPEYRKLSQNKIAEKAILCFLNIPTPQPLGVLHRSRGRSTDGSKLTTAVELENLLLRSGAQRVAFKPVEGWAGVGFRSVEVHVGRMGVQLTPLGTDQHLSSEQFLFSCNHFCEGKALLVEEFFRQHPQMAQFNPSSVNTLRVWVVRQEDNLAKVILVYLRLGRAGSLVDNQSSGGLVAKVDLTSGMTGVAIDGLPSRREYPLHPDHNSKLEGHRIPFFTAALDLARTCLLAFPGLKFAGLDVAIGPAGPVIIELNASPDKEGAAFTDTPINAWLCHAPRRAVAEKS